MEDQFGMVPYLLLFKQLDPNHYDAMKALFYQHKSIADLDVQQGRCIMVGDTKLDIVAAKEAGIRSVLLESYGAKDGFLEAAPDYKYSDFKSFAMELMKEDE